MSADPRIPLTGSKKAAIFLILLGDDAATKIYQNLPATDLQLVTQEIADLDFISPEVATEVLEEYQRLSVAHGHTGQGGRDYASKLLTKAFGEDGAKSLLEQVTREQEASAQNLDSLQKADPQQLAKFLQGEHPQTIALILAHLSSHASRALLVLLPEKLRGQAVKRLAEMQQFSPEMVKKISLILHKRLMSLGKQSRRAYGGIKAVADLLNQVDQASSTAILETIEQGNTDLATSIRNLMFTFEDFLEVQDAGIRELLGQVDKKTLGIALKGASEDLKNHVFKCMSSRAVEMLKEDMEAMGPIRSREVASAQQEVVNTARKLEAEGKMILKSESEEAYVV